VALFTVTAEPENNWTLARCFRKELSADLIRNHCTVLATNQHSLCGIVQAILLIGRAIGCSAEAENLASDFECQLQNFRRDQLPRPRVYFEEWDEPLITGIGWVSEAINLVGGEDIFFRPDAKASRERAVESTVVCSQQTWFFGVLASLWIVDFCDPVITFSKTMVEQKLSGSNGALNRATAFCQRYGLPMPGI
jgi:hypothetical protein